MTVPAPAWISTAQRHSGDRRPGRGRLLNFSADAGSFSSPDTAVSTGHCYRYTFTIADRVGNVSSAVTATAKVDTDAPNVSGDGTDRADRQQQPVLRRRQPDPVLPSRTAPAPSRCTPPRRDGQSSVTQVAFPNVGSVSGWAGSIGGPDSSNPYTSPNDYSWGPGATAPGARSITATNAAAIDGVATITLAADSTAPTGQTLTLTGANVPYYNAASVTYLAR